MRSLFSLLLLAGIALPQAAEARPHHHPHVRVVTPAPRVSVVVSPWAYGYRPAPRTGWVWVEGHYDRDSVWIPGYWMPAQPRPGYAWVAGHWEGDRYLEGYWREIERPGYVWVEGYYDRAGRWVVGYWGPAVAPPPPPPATAVHHDYP
jgi:hypothetical protein